MKNLFIPALAAGLAIVFSCRTYPAGPAPQLSPATYNDRGNPPMVYGLSTKGVLLKTYTPTQTMIQREALGLDQTNGNIFITSEKIPAPIYVAEPLSIH